MCVRVYVCEHTHIHTHANKTCKYADTKYFQVLILKFRNKRSAKDFDMNITMTTLDQRQILSSKEMCPNSLIDMQVFCSSNYCDDQKHCDFAFTNHI